MRQWEIALLVDPIWFCDPMVALAPSSGLMRLALQQVQFLENLQKVRT